MSVLAPRSIPTAMRSRVSVALICAGLSLVGMGSATAQQVAILDTGVDPDAGLNIQGGFNYFLNTPDTTDVSVIDERTGEGHGTTSARLVAESFSGAIVPYIVTDGIGETDEQQSMIARDSALSDILGKDPISVVGITWGTAGVTGTSAALLPSLSEAGKVVAIAAGNAGANQPNNLATASFNLPGVIIVGASDFDGEILSFSNRAGTAQNRFVTGIGIPDPDSLNPGGTSWATARIAGIAGAVLSQNPALSAQEVADVIFLSAIDRGELGTDEVYGRGVILSAEQVLNNVIGPVTVPTTPDQNGSGGSGGGGGGGAGLLLGGALAGALLLARRPSEKLEKTLVLDSYGRTFEIDLGRHVAIEDESLDLDMFFNALTQTSVNQSVYLPALKTEVGVSALGNQNDPRDLIAYFAAPDDRVINDGRMQYSFALASKLSENVSLSMGHRVDPNLYFGGFRNLSDNDQLGRASFLSGESFGSLLSGFSPQANSIGLEYQQHDSVLGQTITDSGFKASMGLVSVNESERFGKESFSSIFEGGYEFADHGGLSLQFGQIQEQGTLFGGAAGGIFGVDQATTYAVSLNGHIEFSANTSLVATYGVGRTRVNAERESLLGDFSSLNSDWYSVGLVTNNIWSYRDQLGVSVSQPLKITSGSLTYSIPVERNQFGDIAFDAERVNLGETNSTEQRFEAYYRNRVDEKLELGAFLTFRDDPNHIQEAGDQLTLMFTLRYQP